MHQLQKIRKLQSGFTLIEIAIVMVIIGLLLGGVLKGQEMITNARLKNVVNDFNGISAAIFSYQDRYNALPGDDPGGDGRWGGTAALGAEGDGVVAGAYTIVDGSTESSIFWEHLHSSGLIAGTALDHPTTAFGGLVGVEDAAMGLGGLSVCMNGIEAQYAEIIDTQMDDGNALTGDLRGSDTDTAVANLAAYNSGTLTDPFIICKSL